jgi:hypothetical protein
LMHHRTRLCQQALGYPSMTSMHPFSLNQQPI